MKVTRIVVAAMLLVVTTSNCRRTVRKEHTTDSQAPRLSVAPLASERGQWKVAASDTVTLSVAAPGAQQVRILYRPEGTEELELTTLTAPRDLATGLFATELKTPADFAGVLSAEATYAGGTVKESEAITVTTATAVGRAVAQTPSGTGGSVGTDESARSDKLTGGRIEQARFKPGDPNIRITINAPAFQLTLWQSGKEVKTYPIGIGRKNFPLVIGEREATAVIFNPRWIPPDSAWVRRTKGVEPYERIEPDDPRNPLGKIKIPLGDGYLIHEAAKPSDIGNLVSHGCVRLLTDDLFDLAEKIIAARSLPVTRAQIAAARASTERLEVKLATPLLVDINYDPQVVEGGVLYLYPDVYDRGAFSVESLRAELQSSGVDAAQLDEQMINELMGRVSRDEKFAIRVADIKAGRFSAGQNLPLIAQEGPEKKRH